MRNISRMKWSYQPYCRLNVRVALAVYALTAMCSFWLFLYDRLSNEFAFNQQRVEFLQQVDLQDTNYRVISSPYYPLIMQWKGGDTAPYFIATDHPQGRLAWLPGTINDRIGFLPQHFSSDRQSYFKHTLPFEEILIRSTIMGQVVEEFDPGELHDLKRIHHLAEQVIMFQLEHAKSTNYEYVHESGEIEVLDSVRNWTIKTPQASVMGVRLEDSPQYILNAVLDYLRIEISHETKVLVIDEISNPNTVIEIMDDDEGRESPLHIYVRKRFGDPQRNRVWIKHKSMKVARYLDRSNRAYHQLTLSPFSQELQAWTNAHPGLPCPMVNNHLHRSIALNDDLVITEVPDQDHWEIIWSDDLLDSDQFEWSKIISD